MAKKAFVRLFSILFLEILSSYTSLLCLNTAQEQPAMTAEMMSATANPHALFSIPLMRFIPKKEATSIGTVRMMVTAVSVRITVFTLLLMMLE